MTGYRRALIAGLGAAAAAVLWAGSASAQYYREYDPYYDGPRRGYGGYERYDRGYGYGRGYDRGYGYGSRYSLEEQKQMIRNHRQAQKEAIKRGYVAPSGGYRAPSGHNPYAGFTVQRGPYGSFAVPINPGTGGNPNN